ALCPNPEWFTDYFPLNASPQEVIEQTIGKWIIESPELVGMSAKQVEHMKAMLSRAVDGPVRRAYAHLTDERPRQFVVIGTTNSRTYLRDATGGRRFWPVRVGVL